MRPVAALILLAACVPEAVEPEAVEPGPTIITPSDAAAAVDGPRTMDDLTLLAVPRGPGSAGWQAAQDRCAEVFEEAGFTVQTQDYGTGINVVGRKAGTSTSASAVVISAHYDSVPGCAGADDNASGVAGVLEAARVLGEGTWANDLVVACWDEEERGLLGSEAWVADAQDAKEDIALAWSLEMIGFSSSEPDSQTLPTGFEFLFPDAVAVVEANDWRGDFITFVGDEGTAGTVNAFRTHAGDVPVVDLVLSPEQVASPLLADLQRSDHASFWAAGYPAVMVTDTSEFRYAAYHCREGQDAVGKLDPDFVAASVRAVVGASAKVLEPGAL